MEPLPADGRQKSLQRDGAWVPYRGPGRCTPAAKQDTVHDIISLLDWTRRETPERQLGFVVALIPVIERCQHAQCERGGGYAPLGVPPPPDAVTAGGTPRLNCTAAG